MSLLIPQRRPTALFRRIANVAFLASCLTGCASTPPKESRAEPSARQTVTGSPLSTFDFTVNEWPIVRQVDFLRNLGFDGLATSSPSPDEVSELAAVPAVTRGDFRFVTTLWMMGLDRPIDRDYLERILPAVARAGGFFWVMFGPGEWTGNPDKAKESIPKIQALADLARRHDVTVVLYPHAGTPLLTAEQALQWVKDAGRDNIRISLHLCHELKAGNRDRLAEIMDRVLPHVAVVTVNGADRIPDEKGWEHTIQPLDRGDFDVNANFVQPLFRRGYRGPIVLHTYGIKDSPEDHFKRSMATWRAWTQRQ